jgi:hypothetical protein
MAKYAVETRATEPKNFFAGDFPTVPETGTAGAALVEHTPVAKNETGEIVAVTKDTAANVIGITAEAAAKDEPVVYYMTGEFFEDAINLPDGVEIADIKDSLRKVSIFLR